MGAWRGRHRARWRRCPGEVGGGQVVLGLDAKPRRLDFTSQAIRSRHARDIITIRIIRKVTGSCVHGSREWALQETGARISMNEGGTKSRGCQKAQ